MIGGVAAWAFSASATGATLAADVNITCTYSADLTTYITPAVTSTASLSATSTLRTSIGLSSVPNISLSSITDFSTGIKMAAAPAASLNSSASLSVESSLSAAISASLSSVASLTSQITLALSDQRVVDATSNNRNLAALGDLSISTTTKQLGVGALYIPSDDGGGVLRDSDFGEFNNQSVTVECWYRPDQATIDSSISRRIVDNSWNTDGSFALVHVPANRILMDIHHGSGETSTISSTTLAADTWYHIAGIWDNDTGEVKVAVNGVIENTFDAGTTTLQPWNPGGENADLVQVGATYATDDTVQAYIDDLRIWSTARTQTQLADNKDSELTGDEAGLMAYYKFDALVADTLSVIAGAQLTTGIFLDSTAGASLSTSAELTTSIELVSSASSSLSVSADLSVDNSLLQSSASASLSAQAALTSAITMSAASTGALTQTAALSTSIELSGAPPISLTSSASLTSSIQLDAAQTASLSAVSDLSTGIDLNIAANADLNASAALTTSVELSAAPTSTTTATADLTAPAGGASLQASADIAITAVMADLTTGITLAAMMDTASTGTAVLRSSIVTAKITTIVEAVNETIVEPASNTTTVVAPDERVTISKAS